MLLRLFEGHNMFTSGRHGRTISLNTTYIILTKNVRDLNQISYLFRQVCPGHSHDLMMLYKELMDENTHNHLLLDLSQSREHILRFRTNIFNPNYTTILCEYPDKGKINGIDITHETFKETKIPVIYISTC